MDTGRADRVALQDLQIPEHATNRTFPKISFLVASLTRIGSPLVGQGGAGGTGRTQRQPQPLHPLSSPKTLVSSFQIRDTSILWKSNTVKTPCPTANSRPPSSSTATYITISLGPQLKSSSIIFC
eukprot:72297-Pelagomonas_calceolata.AAC.1